LHLVAQPGVARARLVEVGGTPFGRGLLQGVLEDGRLVHQATPPGPRLTKDSAPFGMQGPQKKFRKIVAGTGMSNPGPFPGPAGRAPGGQCRQLVPWGLTGGVPGRAGYPRGSYSHG